MREWCRNCYWSSAPMEKRYTGCYLCNADFSMWYSKDAVVISEEEEI